MSTQQLNNLSVSYLAQIRALVESKNYRVVYMEAHPSTMKTIKGFLRVVLAESPSETLWGAFLLQSKNIDPGILRMGCTLTDSGNSISLLKKIDGSYIFHGGTEIDSPLFPEMRLDVKL